MLGAIAALFLLALFFDPAGSRLFDPDEARYAEIPRGLVQTHDWKTFRLNGSAYYEKPPLLYWLNAASISVLGETPSAARLATRLAALGTFLLLLFKLGSPAAGLWAALVYISALLPFALGRINLTDGLVSGLLALTFFLIRDFFAERARGGSALKEQLLIGVAAALAMLAKGLIALVLPGLVLITWVAITRRWRDLAALVFSLVPVVFLAMTVPVFMLIEKHNPGFNHFFFIREHFQRYSSGIHQRTGPIHYFIPVFLLGLLPWTAFFCAALRPFFPLSLARMRARSDELYFALWTFVPFAFFSISNSKLIPYILPSFPAAAAIMGLWIANRPSVAKGWWLGNALFITALAAAGLLVTPHTTLLKTLPIYKHVAAVAFFMTAGAWTAFFLRRNAGKAFAALAVGWLGMLAVTVSLTPRLALQYSDHEMGEITAAAKPDEVVCYRGYSHGLRWYLNRDVPVVEFRGELASDGVLKPELFWSVATFWERWNSGERMVVMVPGRGKSRPFDDFRLCPTPPVVLVRNHHNMLVANFDPSEK